MSVLKQYLIRKGISGQRIDLIRQAGQVTVPPDWVNYFIDEQMLFSHRCNRYTSSKQYSTDNQLHVHGYYELIVHIRGEVEYIQNDKMIHPRPYTVMWCRPGSIHAVHLDPCEYERYLLYFSPEFFAQYGDKDGSILRFLQDGDVFAVGVDAHRVQTLQSLLEKLEQTLQTALPYKNMLARALLVELFAFFNTAELGAFESQSLNDPIAQVKKYIDRAYADITGIEQIAEEFHYSREHLSRKFKDRFNTSVSEYLTRRRVIESTRLLAQMPITEVCYGVGFRSPSAYIAAFKKNIGCLPSEYKNNLQNEKPSAH